MINQKDVQTWSRSYEIIHKTGYDIVVNHQTDCPERVDGLLTLIDNFPNSWHAYNPYPQDSRWGSLEAENPSLFIDNTERPDFFAKRRTHAADMRKRLSHFDKVLKPNILAFSSLVNEMAFAPRIKQILEGQEVQGLAKKYGFSSIGFVEPLIGLIFRKPDDKFMFYNFAEGIWFENFVRHCDKRFDKFIEDNGFPFLQEMYKTLKDLGVYPHDFGLGQVIISSNDDQAKLWLIDTEAWTPIVKS